MAYPSDVRNEALALYLSGFAPADIARELARRRPEERTPSEKTVETWAYEPGRDGKNWPERRAEAEAVARDTVVTEYADERAKVLATMVRLRERLAERVRGALDASDGPGNLSQELYALINVSRFVDKGLDARLAEEARAKDAVDCLLEAIRRVVPAFDRSEARVRDEWRRLVAEKGRG